MSAIPVEKIVTAAEAVSRVRSGDRVFIASGCAIPTPLVEALAEREDLRGVEIIHLMTANVPAHARLAASGRFRVNAFFVGADTRSAVAEGRADYTPVHLSEIPALFRSGAMRVDVALLQTTPPDAHGMCSYGISVDICKAAAESARTVVAQINSRMPRTLGDSFVPSDRVDVFVNHDQALPEMAFAQTDVVSDAIGRHVASLVEDGATLQLGIGAIPNAVLAALKNHSRLGVHTEMFSDGLLPLIESGVVTNERKGFHDGKIVTSFVLGSRALYDYVHDNAQIEFHPSEYVNDPSRVARNRKMTSINSAIEVDLTGQVCADSMGHGIYSGFGGQLDFVRGAAMSPGGKPVIALPSTARGGTASRIVPALRPGAGVVTTRADVRYVVTEYGVAYLHGKTLSERAHELVRVAHPAFRESLETAARENKRWLG